ncbi:MAG: Ig-like domain-containing protein [Pseudomonadota bacterium]
MKKKTCFNILLLLIFSLILFSCQKPLKVLKVSPDDETSDVEKNPEIIIEFTTAVNPDTLNSDTIYLQAVDGENTEAASKKTEEPSTNDEAGTTEQSPAQKGKSEQYKLSSTKVTGTYEIVDGKPNVVRFMLNRLLDGGTTYVLTVGQDTANSKSKDREKSDIKTVRSKPLNQIENADQKSKKDKKLGLPLIKQHQSEFTTAIADDEKFTSKDVNTVLLLGLKDQDKAILFKNGVLRVEFNKPMDPETFSSSFKITKLRASENEADSVLSLKFYLIEPAPKEEGSEEEASARFTMYLVTSKSFEFLKGNYQYSMSTEDALIIPATNFSSVDEAELIKKTEGEGEEAKETEVRKEPEDYIDLEAGEKLTPLEDLGKSET